MPESIITLPTGWTLRSGGGDSSREAGDYVRLCRPDGTESLYWDHAEWRAAPVEVMGAIFAAAARTEKIEERLAQGRPGSPTT